jgi:DNA-directed RNA polymerase specialized sigma24 family protein
MWSPYIHEEIQSLFNQDSPWDSPAYYAAWVVYDIRREHLREYERGAKSAARAPVVEQRDLEHERYLDRVRGMRAAGYSYKKIADALGRSVGAVHLAAKRGADLPRHGRNQTRTYKKKETK